MFYLCLDMVVNKTNSLLWLLCVHVCSKCSNKIFPLQKPTQKFVFDTRKYLGLLGVFIVSKGMY